jgi:quinoprotein glucose dehydrogenase
VPGEETSPTQPVPTRPAPFETQDLSPENLINFTPELRAEAEAILKQYVTGPLFTPPSVRGEGPGATKGTIQAAGAAGGASWPGGSFDPETGMLYIPSRSNPFVADLVEGNPQETNLAYRAGTRPLIQGPRGLPLTKPPYGRITAIDLNTGEHKWMVANGDGPRDHPDLKALNLGPLGEAVPSATIATKTLLFVTEADAITPRSPAGAGGRTFKALDKATGRIVWQMELEAGANGAPMTYMFKGKQYIVFAIGGQNHPAEVVALALGEQ